VVAGRIGIGGGDELGRKVRDARGQQRPQRLQRPGPDAAGGGEVERVGAWPFEDGQAQGVDRRLDHDEPGGRHAAAGHVEQRLVAAGGHAAPARPTHLDVGEPARMVAVREPGRSLGALADQVVPGGQVQDAARQAAGLGQIAPDGAADGQSRGHGPTLGHRQPGLLPRAAVELARAGGDDAGECPQSLTYGAEAQPGLQMLDQVEHVALGGGMGRVPPAAAAMVDDDDLTLAATVLERRRGARAAIEPPGRRRPLEHGGTVHRGLEPGDLLRIVGMVGMRPLGPAELAGRRGAHRYLLWIEGSWQQSPYN